MLLFDGGIVGGVVCNLLIGRVCRCLVSGDVWSVVAG